ncbi:MAG: radical SAM protein [Candidatus Omnitrophica bacterium]|nr:radical SAM protein [Candidatus Omnitrophota bacterium]
MGLTTDSEGRRKVSGLLQSAVFGPVDSRRFGRSLGVNPLPAGMKICSFDCPYCECGPTVHSATGSIVWPTVESILERVLDVVEVEFNAGRAIDTLTLAGNGEPTRHPNFRDLVQGLSVLRRVFTPIPKLVVLTNGVWLGRGSVRAGLEMADEASFKLDAGTPETHHQINQPAPDFDYDGMVSLLASFPQPVIQAMFVRGRIDNTRREEVDAWLERIRAITPKRVDLYSLDRTTPDPSLLRVPPTILQEIANRVEEETGTEARVY